MIRRLTLNDYGVFRDMRMEALVRHPEVFGASEEEEVVRQERTYRAWLMDSVIYGAFNEDRIVGVAGFFVNQGLKVQHKGTMFSVYVREEARGKGVADALIKVLLSEVPLDVVQVHCTVITANKTALDLYIRNGFEVYGTEPRALRSGNVFYDECLMVNKIR